MLIQAGGSPAERTRRAGRLSLPTLLVALAFVTLMVVPGAGEAAGRPGEVPFEPVKIQRINLPAKVTEAMRPLFTSDGRHLLFWLDDELWITSLKGRGTHCLSCGVANSPRSPGEDLATPFRDGKRVFFGGYVQPGQATMAVLECRPSIVRCRSKKILPVDFSAASPGTIQPGGPYTQTQINLFGQSSAKLSPDGRHVGFSDLRTDSLLNMVVARLKRQPDSYVLTDPKVINPPGPESAADRSVDGWAESSALYEFKSFGGGGAYATYVQVGGSSSNPDVWKVNLATGERTRLTSHPDWDEDNAISPDGRSMALWSGRTMHFSDWMNGLLRVRDFIRAPLGALGATAIGANKMCHGPVWLLPASGDRGGKLSGQPILTYRYRNVFVTNNLTGAPQWSPDGTMIALNTNYTTQPYTPDRGKAAPFILVAKLTSRTASKPTRTVSSKVGEWAPSPSEYHGGLGYKGTFTLAGPAGGSVTVTYDGEPGPGLMLGGEWSETYDGYSDNGVDFVSGTATVRGLTEGSYSSHLVMTGRNQGRVDTEITLERYRPSGSSISTLNGHTISGPDPDLSDAGTCRGMLPVKPKLRFRSRRARPGRFRIEVFSGVGQMGLTESATDVRPVRNAVVKIGHRRARTNRHGVAVIRARPKAKVRVTAGDTLRAVRGRL